MKVRKGGETMYQILLVEDEYHIRNIIKEYFTLRDIEIIEAVNGQQALELMDSNINLVLLDIMMPQIDGYEVCKRIRKKYRVPIIFISALSQEDNQLLGYELGADDYMTKPFKPSILYMKCLAFIKRDQKVEDNVLRFGHIKLDKENHLLMVDENIDTLTHKEFEVLSYLCDHHGQLLSRDQILDYVWGYDYFGDGRAVDTYIKKLRKKLGKYACYIHTVVKTGYMFKVVECNEVDNI